jgi:mycothiol S-conjugate amidase
VLRYRWIPETDRPAKLVALSHLACVATFGMLLFEPWHAAGRLVEVMRSFRPHVVTTYDENGGYPHPDHVKCHEVTVAAFEAAGDPRRYTDAGPPWQPAKLYYHHSFSRSRAVALHEAMVARGEPSPYADRLQDWKADPTWDERVTTRVPCAEWFPVRDRALLAHATQIDPDGFWFAVPTAVQQEAWPTEDYELVQSTVDVELPEDDLFAGLRRGHATMDG